MIPQIDSMQVLDDPLWQRIAAHPLEIDDCPQSFIRRLERGQGWDRQQALAAILEYRRFVYLALRAGHPVTPSQTVDEVWHLHLTYTRDYWDSFCADVLGQALHHGPTKGGSREDLRFWQQYAQTLESYERLFGVKPSPPFWPSALQRFAPQRLQVIDRRRFWLLPKPTPKFARQAVAATLALVVLATTTAGANASTSLEGWYEGLSDWAPLVIATIGVLVIMLLGAKRRGGSSWDNDGDSSGCGD